MHRTTRSSRPTTPRTRLGRLAGALAVIALVASACEAPVLTLAVNTTADLPDANPGNGICEATVGVGNCTLRAALDEANATAGKVQVNVPAGTYVLTRVGVDDTNSLGDLDVSGNVDITGQGAVTIDANGIDRVFDVTGALMATNVTVTGGLIGGDGGGIRVTSGNAVLLGVTLTDNVAGGDGGGMAVVGGVGLVLHSTVSLNTAGSSGGGVSTAPGTTLSVLNSTISGNTANPASPALPALPAPPAPPGGPGEAGTGATTELTADAPASTPLQPVDADGLRPVVVELALPGGSPIRAGGEGLDRQAAAVAASTSSFLSAVEAEPGTELRVNRTYSHLPLVALSADQATIDALAADPAVVSVQPDSLSAPTLAQSIPRINADDVQAAGDTGSGTAVAILDTGVDATEPMTDGKVVAEACFALGGDALANGVGDCPDGTDSQTGAGAGTNCPWFTNNVSCWHGTHVASTAAGATRSIGGVSHTGVAVGADIVSVNVFSHFTTTASCGAGIVECVRSYTSDTLAGLNWVLAQSGTIDIGAVNMSLGGGTNATTCDSDTRKVAVDALRAAGIATVISSGNNGSKTGVGAPGCISTAITVGATSDVADTVAAFSQSAPLLDMLAPGESISAEYPTLPSDPLSDLTITASGTSMAAPHVAGAFAVLHAADDAATVDQLEAALESTGVSVTDTNGLIRPRIDLLAARQALAAATGNAVGGGIANAGTATVRYTTITANSAWAGGGVQNTGTITVDGTIVATQALGTDCSGTITSAGYNLATDGTCWTGGTDLASVNPLLGPLTNNGGPTASHLPAVGSPARNSIPNGTAPLCNGFQPNDQRVAVRPASGACDIGALET